MFNPPYWYYDNVKFSDIEIINLKTDLFGSEKTEEMSKIVDYVNSLGLNIPKLKIDPVRQISTYHYDMDNKPDNIFKERYDVIVEDILKNPTGQIFGGIFFRLFLKLLTLFLFGCCLTTISP